nr:epimerase [Rhizobium sp. Q54]
MRGNNLVDAALPHALSRPVPGASVQSVGIIGGTGLVGREIASQWPADVPPPLFFVHRSFPEWLRSSAMPHVRIELGDTEATERAFSGTRILINLMRPDGSGQHPALLRRIAPLWRRAGVRRCVYASSIDVYAGSKDRLIDEGSEVCPLSSYEVEHLSAENILSGIFDDVRIARLGAVFGSGGKNIVKFAEEMRDGSYWKLALRRALYGQRRMHLVSSKFVARALIRLTLAESRQARSTVLVTQDAHPENNFAFLQDRLAEGFGRPSFATVPILPPSVLAITLRIKGLPVEAAKRRFLSTVAETLDLGQSDFTGDLTSYVRELAHKMGCRQK